MTPEPRTQATAPEFHLLRAVNLGARNKVPMAELRAIAEDLGATGVRTLLNTGNLIVDSSPEGFPEKLVTAIADRLGVVTADVVVGPDEMIKAAAGSPFDPAGFANVSVSFCERIPTAEGLDALGAAAPDKASGVRGGQIGQDHFSAQGRLVYLGYRENVHASRLSTSLLEKRLGMVCTARAMTTVQKLAAIAEEQS